MGLADVRTAEVIDAHWELWNLDGEALAQGQSTECLFALATELHVRERAGDREALKYLEGLDQLALATV